jgi:caffeoyl-CoA O-methyltransferase
MSRDTMHLTEAMQHWLLEYGVQETSVQSALRAAMQAHPHGGMQTSPEQVQFMAMLLRVLQATCVIEIGVFTGYSAIGLAAALPPGGRLIACDCSDDYLAVAAGWWEQAGLADRIEVRRGPALQSLEALKAEGAGGTVDFIYIDADKESSDAYCELGLQLLRTGGVLAIDNMFRGGRVVDPEANDPSTVATRALAAKWSRDARVAWSLLPVGDGLGLACKLAGDGQAAIGSDPTG